MLKHNTAAVSYEPKVTHINRNNLQTQQITSN